MSVAIKLMKPEGFLMAHAASAVRKTISDIVLSLSKASVPYWVSLNQFQSPGVCPA